MEHIFYYLVMIHMRKILTLTNESPVPTLQAFYIRHGDSNIAIFLYLNVLVLFFFFSLRHIRGYLAHSIIDFELAKSLTNGRMRRFVF